MSSTIGPQGSREAMGHLSSDQLKAFGAGDLPAPDFLACDEHLAGCDACRAAFAEMLHGDRSLSSLIQSFDQEAEEHLTYEQVRLLAEGKLSSSDALDHVKECSLCAAEVQDLKVFIEETTIAPRNETRAQSWLYGAIAAAILIAVSVVGMGHFSTGAHREIASGQPAAVKFLPPVLPSEYQALLAQTSASGRLPNPHDGIVAAHDETLLGTQSAAPSFRLLSPVNVTIMSDKPVFLWEPTHATGTTVTYSVAVYDRSYRKVAESGPITTTQWQVEAPLKRGGLYSWSLTVHSSHAIVRIPVPPQSEVLFKVMELKTENQLQSDQEKYGDNHLLMAALFARAGDLDAAKGQLDALAAIDPQSALVPRLRRSLAQMQDSPDLSNSP